MGLIFTLKRGRLKVSLQNNLWQKKKKKCRQLNEGGKLQLPNLSRAILRLSAWLNGWTGTVFTAPALTSSSGHRMRERATIAAVSSALKERGLWAGRRASASSMLLEQQELGLVTSAITPDAFSYSHYLNSPWMKTKQTKTLNHELTGITHPVFLQHQIPMSTDSIIWRGWKAMDKSTHHIEKCEDPSGVPPFCPPGPGKEKRKLLVRKTSQPAVLWLQIDQLVISGGCKSSFLCEHNSKSKEMLLM